MGSSGKRMDERMNGSPLGGSPLASGTMADDRWPLVVSLRCAAVRCGALLCSSGAQIPFRGGLDSQPR